MLSSGSRLPPDELLGGLRQALRAGVPAWLSSAFAGSIDELEHAIAAQLDDAQLEPVRARAETLLELCRPGARRYAGDDDDRGATDD